MKTLQDDDRATSQVVGVLALTVVMVGFTTFAAAGLQTQFENETETQSTVEETQIEAVQSDQVSITPMVGDDIDLENAEVRISFPDRDAPDAVVTNLEAGIEQSETQTVTYEEEVDAGYSTEPVTEEVTYYEQVDTKTHTELDVYEWQRTYDVEVHAYEWEVYEESYWSWYDDDKVATVISHDRPSASAHGGDYVEKVGKAKQYEYETCSGYTGYSGSCLWGSWTTHTTEAANAPDADGDIEVTGWATETEQETRTVEHVKSPSPEWEKVSNDPVGTERYELDEPEPVYEEQTEEVVVGYEVNQETKTVERTATAYVAPQASQNNGNGNNGATVASIAGGVAGTISPAQSASAFSGSAWAGIGGGASSSSDYLSELADKLDNAHSSSSSSSSLSSTSEDIDGDEEYTVSDHYYEGYGDEDETEVEDDESGETYADLSEPGNNSPSPAQAALDNAADAAPFIDGSSESTTADTEPANAAVGVGGTAGESQEGMWTQGESIIVQLDEPRIGEGDRVRVQIIDTEEESVVLDKSIRAEGVEQISFDYDPGDTGAAVGNSPADGGGVTVDDVSVDAPETDLGDLPGASAQNPDDGLGSSPPDNGGDSNVPSSGNDGNSGWDGSDGSSSTPSTGDSSTDSSTPTVDSPTESDTVDSTSPAILTGTGHTDGMTVDVTGIGGPDCDDCGSTSPEGSSTTYSEESGDSTEKERYYVSSPTTVAKPVASSAAVVADAAAGLVSDHDPVTNTGRMMQLGGDLAASAAEENSVVADVGETLGIREDVSASSNDNRDFQGDSVMEGAWETVTGEEGDTTTDGVTQIEDPDTSTTQDKLSELPDTSYGTSEETADPNSGVGYTSGSDDDYSSPDDDDDYSSSDDDSSSSYDYTSGQDTYGGNSSPTNVPDSGVGHTTDSTTTSSRDSTTSSNNDAGYVGFGL
jgi:hypothetical protein